MELINARINYEKKMEFIQVRVDSESKRKAMFVLKSHGKDLSTAVREMCDKLAQEFDRMNGKREK